jgi:hypothetical protein
MKKITKQPKKLTLEKEMLKALTTLEPDELRLVRGRESGPICGSGGDVCSKAVNVCTFFPC